METKWLNPSASFERLILAGDIGGTNTNLGLVAYNKGQFTLILETVFPSQSINDLVNPIQQTLHLAKDQRADLVPSHCCISGAGPVANNVCTMTNLKWIIDGNDIAKQIGIPTIVINDFLAISYGIPTLDVHNPQQIHPLAHSDGSLPEPQAATKVVIGPGTGMGVSFLAFDGKRYIPASSEGGHMAFPAFDDKSESFKNFMAKEIGMLPGIEPLVSGTGISNMYRWWKHTYSLPNTADWQAIDTATPSDRPKMISKLSNHDPIAAEMMTLFVKMLARFASDVSAMTLPLGGFYLAGGVAQKELRWLEKDRLFTRIFEQNYNPNLVPILRKIPVFLIKDYSISLYGAANASINLQVS